MKQLARSLGGRVFGSLLLGASLVSCSSVGTPIHEIAPEINATRDVSTLVLGPGDELEISFHQESSSQWNHDTQVLADGRAAFLGLGDIPVAGLTLADVDDVLEQAYAETVRSPELTVIPTTLAGRSVTVIGQVQDPGPQQLGDPRLTLLGALGNAGGPNVSYGNLKHIVLVRWDPSEQRQLRWHIDARPEFWGGGEPIYLQPYDIVVVPDKRIVTIANWVDLYIGGLIPFPSLVPIV